MTYSSLHEGLRTTRRRSARLSILGCLFIPLVWAALHYGGDRHATPTLLLFGPRWIVALALIVLAPIALYSRSKLAVVLVVLTGLLIAGPITGGRLNVSNQIEAGGPALQRLRIVSWNMGGAQVGPLFRQFIAEVDPIIVVCQEASIGERDLPVGWKVFGRGGNRVASRLPVRLVGSLDLTPIGAPGGLDLFALETSDGEISVVNVHLPTPRPGIEAAISSKGRDLSELLRMIEIRGEASRASKRWVSEHAGNMILVGDFNMPVESHIYRQVWGSFRNAFEEAGVGWGQTKQTRWFGTRIDHILYPAPWRCRKCWIGPAMGSDHKPVIAELEWTDSVD